MNALKRAALFCALFASPVFAQSNSPAPVTAVNAGPFSLPCVTVGVGIPGVGAGSFAERLEGVLDMSLGGHIAWQDSSTCTMASGACPTITLTGSYYSDPDRFANWTGQGTLTGLLKVGYHVDYGASTLSISSSVNTDTAVVHYACFGH